MEKLLKAFNKNCDVDAVFHLVENALVAMIQFFPKVGEGGWRMPKYVL
jgi:hypothetical protein